MKPAQGVQWPETRSGHSASALNYGEDHPMVLVSGGLGEGVETLKDMWILDVDSGKWIEVRMSFNSKFLCDLDFGLK